MHIFCYKYTHLKRQKSISMTAANPTQRSGDSHTKKIVLVNAEFMIFMYSV